jgi:multidrug efflux pump subunit AcrA (membrane-fusion protein)
MSKVNDRPWLNIVLALLCVAAIVVAYTTVGQASQTSTQTSRTATVQKGVVQSTVSGSGNIQAASQLNLGFKTSGTVTHIYVTQGEQVAKGQLLATLNPQGSEVTLEQAKASLQSAEANLAKEEENGGQTSSESSSAPTAKTATASTASAGSINREIAYTASNPTATPTSAPARPSPTTPTTATRPTSTTTTPATTTAPSSTTSTPTTTTTPTSTTTTPKRTTTTPSSAGTTTTTTTAAKEKTETVSSATREANLASAKANVKSDKLTVQSDEQAVQNTKLYAPEDGTVVTLSGEVGETVSATGTTKAASSSSSSSSSSSTGAGGKSSSPSGSAESSNSSSSSSSGSSFAVLSDLSSMQLVVPLSESEIGNVRDGQTATVTIEALGSRKVAAHVLSVDQLSTSNSGVVSYDVTFQLDQLESGLKAGMSATAEVVVKQAEGVNVPTTAISRGSVTVVHNGKHVSQAVTTGLAGDSSTIILAGLNAGEQIVLPSATSATTSSSKSGLSSRIGSRLGGAGLGGGLGGGGGFPRGGPGG